MRASSPAALRTREATLTEPKGKDTTPRWRQETPTLVSQVETTQKADKDIKDLNPANHLMSLGFTEHPTQ